MDVAKKEPQVNRRRIRLGSSHYLVIDLTQPLDLDVEVYPGDPKPEKEIFSSISETGYEHHVYKLGDHNFHPHGDAPSHQNPELTEEGFEMFDMAFCFNRACLIDLSGSEDSRPVDGVRYLTRVEKRHLEPFAERLAGVGAVLIRTGYDRWLESNRPHTPDAIPYLSGEAAGFIAAFDRIKVVGVDSITIDGVGSHDAHRALNTRLIVESMVHLHDIPTDGRSRFDLQTTPVRIVGATGGPVVAYAFVEL